MPTRSLDATSIPGHLGIGTVAPGGLGNAALMTVPGAGVSGALFETGATKAFQIMFAIGVLRPGQLGRDPG